MAHGRKEKARPFMQIETDAIGALPFCARAAGVPEAALCWGLVQLWYWCWRQKVADVPRVVLDGFVPGAAFTALEGFNFVRTNPDGTVHVCGMGRYTRVAAAQVLAAQRTNAKRWGSESLSESLSDAQPPKVSVSESVSESLSESESDGRIRESENQRSRDPINDPQPPSKPARKLSWQQRAWKQMQALRSDRLTALGRDPTPEPKKAAGINSLLGTIATNLLAMHNEGAADAPPEEDPGWLVTACWDFYLRWDGGLQLDPPFALQVFASPKVLRRCFDDWSRAAAEAA